MFAQKYGGKAPLIYTVALLRACALFLLNFRETTIILEGQ